MKNEKKWEKIAFSDAFEINPKVDLVKGRIYPFINMDAMNQNNRNVFRSEYREYTGSGSKFISDDILMARITPCLENGKIAGYKSSEKEEEIAFGSTEFIVIRGKKGLTDNTFAYYVTRWMKFRNYAIAQMTGSSGRQRVPVDSLKGFSFYLPPLPTQEQIADILSTLDNKIELNQQMNQTLENMARAIFKSWFVDFDPVYAKMEGRDYPLPAEIMELFPDELVDSELGLIPKGWRIKPLDNIADFLNGLAMQKYPAGENKDYIPVIKIRELRNGFTSQNSDRANINFPYDYIINNGDILFSWSGSLLVKIWCGGIGGLNQHLFKVTSTEFPKWFYYLWTSYYLNEFIKIAADKATTMGHIKTSDLHKSLVCIPDASILDAGNSFIGNFFEKTINNSLQISTLMKTRDSLLPYLVSGKIEI